MESEQKKRAIRQAAEAEERKFYGADGDDPKASQEWLDALAELGTDEDKPFLKPRLISSLSLPKERVAFKKTAKPELLCK